MSSQDVMIKIAQAGSGNSPPLTKNWDGTMGGGGASAPAASDISASNGVGKGSTTALAGSASYQTATQVPPASANFFIAEATADQVGTLFVEKLIGATWYAANGAGTAHVANATTTVKVPVVSGTGYRARFLNGATPNTVFSLLTNFSPV